MTDSTSIKYHSRLGESVGFEARETVSGGSGTPLDEIVDLAERLRKHAIEWAYDYCRNRSHSVRDISKPKLHVGWGHSPPIVISVMISLIDHST